MDGYVSKPIRAMRLFEAIDDVLNRLKPTGEEVRRPRLDWPKAMDVVQGDHELLREIVTTFLDEYPRMYEALEGAVRDGQAKEIQRLAHLIKGSMRYLGARQAFDRADELETMGRESRLDGATDGLEQLRTEIEHITPELSRYVASGKSSLAGRVASPMA
jgi:HPt (histidine-containing phosphotransfer) domain-containing protein